MFHHMKQDIVGKITAVKRKYEPEGFIVLGVFGSYARGEETPESDVDILYEFREPFYSQYSGWEAFGRLEAIKADIEIILGKKVDLADRDALDEIGKRFILTEVTYVS